ncbi:hypothetical protein E2C01_072737 [Portunus trituberculatus]|uniref:Uncharacterized protein n=1 Tax=Portunus trituberculatus TaxID=210409 RepID=A0A5B7I7G6_PORTR|nr:hypothetical protein [Portunus trituberculatus]
MNRHIHQIRTRNKEGDREPGHLEPCFPTRQGDRHPSDRHEISLPGTTL